jgi:hypothetical protein
MLWSLDFELSKIVAYMYTHVQKVIFTNVKKMLSQFSLINLKICGGEVHCNFQN